MGMWSRSRGQDLGLQLRLPTLATARSAEQSLFAFDLDFNFIGLSANHNLHFQERLRSSRASCDEPIPYCPVITHGPAGPGCAKPERQPAPAVPIYRAPRLASAEASPSEPEPSCRAKP